MSTERISIFIGSLPSLIGVKTSEVNIFFRPREKDFETVCYDPDKKYLAFLPKDSQKWRRYCTNNFINDGIVTIPERGSIWINRKNNGLVIVTDFVNVRTKNHKDKPFQICYLDEEGYTNSIDALWWHAEFKFTNTIFGVKK